MVDKKWAEYLVQELFEADGYDVIHIGVPDLILLKDGKIEFVEVKVSGDKLSEHQKRAIGLLHKHGFEARVRKVMKPKFQDKYVTPKEMDDVRQRFLANNITLAELWNLIGRSLLFPDHHDNRSKLITCFNILADAPLDDEDEF